MLLKRKRGFMKKYSIITLLISISILIYGVLTIMADERYFLDDKIYVSYRYEITCIMLYGIAFLICGLSMYIFHKTISSQCALKTSFLSICLSATAALGLHCGIVRLSNYMFDELGEHPFSNPASEMGLFVATILFIVFMCFYVKIRYSKPSKIGVIIDVLFAFIYIIPFYYTYLNIHTYLSDLLAAYYDKVG